MPLVAKPGDPPDKKALARAYKLLGIRFREPEALIRAITHTSYANENPVRSDGRPTENNERDEFLGDAVLDLVASHLIMERFPRAPEGELSRLRASIVNERRLADVAKRMGIGELLLLGRGEEMSGGRTKDSLLADALEAIVGALFRERGYPAARKFLTAQFHDFLEELARPGFDRDYKTRLQEAAQSKLKATPRYSLVAQTGPDHDKTFEVNLLLSGQVRGVGRGKSKKEAEQAAAKSALEWLAARSDGRVEERG
ncbi:MAG TPA: ribonuclease III [bacterium]|nr:ribonuclease III [bacterium]